MKIYRDHPSLYIFAIYFKERCVFVGSATQSDAHNFEKYPPELRSQILRELAEFGDCEITVQILEPADPHRYFAWLEALKPAIMLGDYDRVAARLKYPRILCVENNTTYENASAAARALGLTQSAVYNCADMLPNVKTAGGYRFVRVR